VGEGLDDRPRPADCTRGRGRPVRHHPRGAELEGWQRFRDFTTAMADDVVRACPELLGAVGDGVGAVVDNGSRPGAWCHRRGRP